MLAYVRQQKPARHRLLLQIPRDARECLQLLPPSLLSLSLSLSLLSLSLSFLSLLSLSLARRSLSGTCLMADGRAVSAPPLLS